MSNEKLPAITIQEIEAVRPMCPFCSSPWGDEAIRLFDLDAGDHCESGRFYAEEVSISITCQTCGREMYRKEGKAIDSWAINP